MELIGTWTSKIHWWCSRRLREPQASSLLLGGSRSLKAFDFEGFFAGPPFIENHLNGSGEAGSREPIVQHRISLNLGRVQ